MLKGVMLSLSLLTLVGTLPASAQTIPVPQRQKVTWFKSVPQIQILDERPLVHDFREAPMPQQMMQLPPGPRGWNRAMGGGSGALGCGGPGLLGGNAIQIAGNGPGYRMFNPGTAIPLDKADYNHAVSNIPINGIHPGSTLPNGISTGVHSRMSPPMIASVVPAQGLNPHHNMAAVVPHGIAPVANYGRDYKFADNVGSANGGAHATTSVHLKMLNMLNKTH